MNSSLAPPRITFRSALVNMLGAFKPFRVITSIDRQSSCSPGRFFASYELKAMAAHLLINYDWKFESGTVRPANLLFAISIFPDPGVKLLFKKRKGRVL